MRTWAADLKRLYGTAPDTLRQWSTTPLAQLTPEQRQILAARDHFLGAPESGIRGSLRDDGLVELDAGRHRAAYLHEQGVDPLPVWVSAADQQRLDQYQARCAQDVREQRTRSADRATRAEEARDREARAARV